MGETVIENSKVEKYLAGKEIRAALNPPATMGHKIAEVAVNEYASAVLSKLISNFDSWIDLTEDHITRMQNVQDNYFREVFQVCAGTPLCMVILDSQTLHIKYQII